MNNKPMSAAQAAQQDNRDDRGRYQRKANPAADASIDLDGDWADGDWDGDAGAWDEPLDAGRLPGARTYSDLDKSERLQAIKDDLLESIDQVIADGKLGQWLDTLAKSRMGRWSMNNRMLATMQLARVRGRLPDDHPHKDVPSMVMSAAAWKREYGAFPAKGSKAIWVLAPCTRTVTDTDGNGEEVSKKIVTGFRPQAKFDISQMQGQGLPDLSDDPFSKDAPHGQAPPGAHTGLADRIRAAGYDFREEEIEGTDPSRNEGRLGYTRPGTREVVVDSRCSPAQKVSVMAHELAHIMHGHTEDLGAYHAHRGRMETEAEATAYMVARALGVRREQSESFSARYIAGWSGQDRRVVQEALTSSGNVFNKIMEGDWPDSDEQA